MSATDAAVPRSSARFARRSTRGVFLGLSASRLTVLGIALGFAVAGIYTAQWTGLLLVMPVVAPLLALGFIPVGGKPAIEWVPTAAQFLVRRALKQTEYRREFTRPRPAGVLALPGDAAALRLFVDETGIAMVHDPHAKTLTAVARVRHPAFVLLDDPEQERRAQGWATALAAWCVPGQHVKRIQVLERTVPDGGRESRSYWEQFGIHDGSWAARSYEQLVAVAKPDGMTHQSLIAMTLDLQSGRRDARKMGGGLKGAAGLLRQRMDAMNRHLLSIPVDVEGWLNPDDLSLLLRTAYDPKSAALLEGSSVGRDPEWAGPLAVSESWDRLRSDSGHHQVLAITQWPRTQVTAGFLYPVLLSSGFVRSFSMVMEPEPAHKAIKKIHRERTAYAAEKAGRAKQGMVESVAIVDEEAELIAREAELVAGHGVYRFVGYIAVSALSDEELENAVARITAAAQQAQCEIRPVYGEQAAAFLAAALPLGRGLK